MIKAPHLEVLAVADQPEWMAAARCVGLEISVFYPRRRGPGRAERAKLVCAQCPVRAECRDHAVDTDEPHGVWGGMTRPERVAWKRRAAETAVPAPAAPRPVALVPHRVSAERVALLAEMMVELGYAQRVDTALDGAA